MSRILVVDDVASMAEQYAYDLRRMEGHEVLIATSGAAAVERITSDSVDCAILDLEMPGMDGFEVLRALRHRGSETPVIVYTGTGNYARCVEAVRLGAAAFIDKAEPMERVVQEVESAIERSRLRREVRSLRQELGQSSLIGDSAGMRNLREMIAKLGADPEPGPLARRKRHGKELVARELHRAGRHPDQALVALNCGALPEHLVESELFGHERGAFTGAVVRRIGASRAPSRGTIFLDELAELPTRRRRSCSASSRSGIFECVGGDEALRVDARVVAATNRDLDAMVREGAFREDLLYRLNVHVIRVPPLRERREDIPRLAEIFVAEICRRFGILPKHSRAT